MVCFVSSVCLSVRKSCQRRDCSELGTVRNWVDHCSFNVFFSDFAKNIPRKETCIRSNWHRPCKLFCQKTLLFCGYNPILSAIWSKGDKFCNFLFATLDDKWDNTPAKKQHTSLLDLNPV